ncbi:hypothetical protein IW140_001945 [Coemansia sp. RSA 1813]|nr:hypothetical protein EV178_001571 [Coemansia sp. RSA 1646]KAJ1771636.1 hypothetical protein LPJ74_002191 [Coemansia sp. RSA 1843]KAJ2089938.1 hypothetical protein IW138_003068 [Coemansia sp. RSA 986]KAJ2215255.1 hypothetical protein EV179_002343 [Coemansia sp. RSA 487]KAJ2570991.1 hypothetical protein IW140_001945 [Coemansia sp. RSA 1813]
MSSAPTAASAPSFLGALEDEDLFQGIGNSVRLASAIPNSPIRPPHLGTGTAPGSSDWYDSKFDPNTPSTSSSSSSYDYSFGVNLSGFDGSITHYYVSYSDPYVSGEIGVGPSQPTPTETRIINQGVACDRSFAGLLSGIGLDLGLRLNLSFIGIDACVAL